MKWKCETCRFWVERVTQGGEVLNFGNCHRYPPVVNRKGIETSFPAHPMTTGDEWCGEWLRKSVE